MIRSASALSKSHWNAVATSRRCGRARSWRRSTAAATLRSSSSCSGSIAAIAGRRNDGRSSSSSSSSSSPPRAALAAAAAAIVAAAFSNARPATKAEAVPNMLEVPATTIMAAASSNQHSHARLSTNAETERHDPDAEMRALGKSLQQSHERQMVRMAKLLHSLETLAEEAEKEKRKEDDETADNIRTAQDETGVEDNATTIRITDAELANLSSSPEKVWEHIEALKGGAIYGREDVKRIARAACAVTLREPSLVDLTNRCQNGGDLKTVTVVGDLHGHFQCSLVKILDMLGEERMKDGGSPWNGTGAVVFNGDFVDRGTNSIEVLIALLLLKLAYPNNVYLNRGNHEDSVIAEVYGCKDELQGRYDGDKGVQDIWKEFLDLFSSLPLAVLTNSAVIMHGGLPSTDFRLEQIAQISSEERFRIKTMVDPAGSDETCKLVQNIMWSDPHPESGVSPNEDRGCGMKYGPDVVRAFLSENGLRYLIRSHEPVDEGYELLECDEHGMSAVTIFSAASYPGGAGFNHGAIVRLQDGGATFDSYSECAHNSLTTKEKMSHTFKAFAEVIASNRAALEEEFEYMAEKRARRRQLQRRFSNAESDSISSRMAFATSATSASAGVVAPVDDDMLCITPEQWADSMKFVLNAELPNVDWLSIQKFIAPGDLINYKRFLNLQCSLSSYDQEQAKGMDDHTRNTILRNHEAIFKVFRFLDEDGSGEVDRDEFCNGINELKRRNPDAAVSFDAEALFDSIDADGSGSIELSEFQHAFQAVDVPYHIAVMMTLDEDKSGTIDRHEFREGVMLLNARLSESEKIPESEGEIDRIFDELDDDGNGELDTEEFEKFVRDYYPH